MLKVGLYVNNLDLLSPLICNAHDFIVFTNVESSIINFDWTVLVSHELRGFYGSVIVDNFNKAVEALNYVRPEQIYYIILDDYNTSNNLFADNIKVFSKIKCFSSKLEIVNSINNEWSGYCKKIDKICLEEIVYEKELGKFRAMD